MGYSPDKMLQARLFAYHDAQLYRVGTNHQHLPVNRPRCPFHNQQRDGAMAVANGGAAPNYDPVRSGMATAGGFGHGDAGWQLEGTAGRYDTRASDDHYTQAGNLFRLLSDEGKRNLIANIAGALSQADAGIQDRQIGYFLKADQAYGQGVAEAIRALADKR
jgi:catalase